MAGVGPFSKGIKGGEARTVSLSYRRETRVAF